MASPIHLILGFESPTLFVLSRNSLQKSISSLDLDFESKSTAIYSKYEACIAELQVLNFLRFSQIKTFFGNPRVVWGSSPTSEASQSWGRRQGRHRAGNHLTLFDGLLLSGEGGLSLSSPYGIQPLAV
ncbi:unnamed protein product [Cuscuta europaea]|uniref:Uncharacterized protein n=1 Tax=Cuscuta europaea TaxID=41803 RepID=A0A9P0YKZ0_CUSEU|nr:unnamed protein product [Cuscuta europaea]